MGKDGYPMIYVFTYYGYTKTTVNKFKQFTAQRT